MGIDSRKRTRGHGSGVPTVCVTGATGFVGYNFTERLVESGVPTIPIDVADRMRRVEHGAPQWAHDLVRVDVRSGPRELRQADVIVHLAALAHVDYSLLHPAEVVRNNVESTLAVLEAAKHSGARVILASSVEVYGANHTGALVEETPLRPYSPYAASKIAAEALAESYRSAFGVKVTVLRFTNNYGPWQAPDRVIPRVLAQRLLGIPSTATRGRRRDFMHVADTVDALYGIVHTEPPASIYNLAASEIADIEALVRALRDDDPSNVTTVESDTGRGADLLADASKLRHDLGWVPTRTLATHLPHVRGWYADHQDWLSGFAPATCAPQGSMTSLTDELVRLDSALETAHVAA